MRAADLRNVLIQHGIRKIKLTSTKQNAIDLVKATQYALIIIYIEPDLSFVEEIRAAVMKKVTNAQDRLALT
jgi:hypothetical protein